MPKPGIGPESEQRRTLRLLALLALDGKRQKDQIRFLDKAGFGGTEIAELLGTTPKAVSVRLAEIRKEARGGKG